MKKTISLAAVLAALLAAAPFTNAADGSEFGASGITLSNSVYQVPAVSGPGGSEKAQNPVPAHGYTPGQRQEMADHNATLQKTFVKGLSLDRAEDKYRPYADYEAPGYLIMSSEFNFDSRQPKLEMASKLPADGTLVIFTDYNDAGTKEGILRAYEGVVPRARIKVITLPRARQGFWARDGIPVPVIDKSNKLAVIDAVYGHGFEPDAEIARLFGTGLEKHQYYFEGGNFQANHSGTCMIVNHGAHIRIPDEIFSGLYGCKQLVRLPFVDGIGHVDEHARFISEKVIVTDIPQYKDILQGKGFTVHMLPKPVGSYETYVNSLIMNDKVIVPVFGRDTDAKALAVYESLGLKASGASSRSLSNQGQGSVHCITMTYPKVPAAELMKALGATEL
ncbi:MAG TPA: hypothetical protein DCZ92_00130 [Elusimicrobia bacterium]|nr:MAG: hypothetical protein A2016_01055 [Elusimicrobia bacterium GWF2_62_30]HBA59234.1 hypothetical protein [Elusimicrobiota bacterium]